MDIAKALVRMVRRFHEDAAEQAFVVNGAVLEKDFLRWERDVYPDDFHTDPNSRVFKSALANAALELQNVCRLGDPFIRVDSSFGWSCIFRDVFT